MPEKNIHDESGFSLIEMAMTIVISGIVFTMVLGMMRPLQVNIPIEQTTITLREIEGALRTHVERYGRLPCPAETTLPPNHSDYGREADCSDASPPSGIFDTDSGRDSREIWIGSVPLRDLDLPEYYARDGWGNRITYAVTKNLAVDGLFDNNEGGIFIEDSAGNSMTDTDGGALYVLISHGEDGKGASNINGNVFFPCTGSTDLDAENCDFRNAGTIDATFISTTKSEGTVFYDDMILYKTYIGSLSTPSCGNRGMIFAPGHPESEADGCLDPGYKNSGVISIDGTANLPCTAVDSFCESPYIDIALLDPGDYLIHWEVNLRFDHPQPSQYALLEFKAGDLLHETQAIPFVGPVCNLSGTPLTEQDSPVQHESGLMRFNLDETPNTTLQVRVRYYGGSNNPPANCAGATPAFVTMPTPTLSLVEEGIGSGDALQTISLDIFRKPQTFGMGPPP